MERKIESREEAKKAMLESLDRLRSEIVAGEVNMLLICGNRVDKDYFVCAHVPPSTPFRTILQSIEHLLGSGVMPAFKPPPTDTADATPDKPIGGVLS